MSNLKKSHEWLQHTVDVQAKRIVDLEKALEDLSFDCFGVFNTHAPSREVYNRTFDVLKNTLDNQETKGKG